MVRHTDMLENRKKRNKTDETQRNMKYPQQEIAGRHRKESRVICGVFAV